MRSQKVIYERDVIYGEKGHLWENSLHRWQNRARAWCPCDVIFAETVIDGISNLRQRKIVRRRRTGYRLNIIRPPLTRR
jgi:hypothetical protein